MGSALKALISSYHSKGPNNPNLHSPILTHFHIRVAKGTAQRYSCSTDAINKFHPHKQLRARYPAQGHFHIRQKSEFYPPTL